MYSSAVIRVNSEHSRIRIRTSFPLEEVDPVVEAFPENLKLVQVRAIESGSDVGAVDPTQPEEKKLLKYGVPIALAVITAASVSGSIALVKAFLPDYKVIVSAPPSKNGVAELSGPFQVGWSLKPDAPSFRRIIKDSPATVRVSAADQPVQTYPGVRPGLKLQLAPGDYIIEVDNTDAEPSQITVRVKAPK